MLMACEELASREEAGRDYSAQNYTIAECKVKLPSLTKDVNHLLKSARSAKQNGQGLRVEIGDGTYCRLGEPHEGWDCPTLKEEEAGEAEIGALPERPARPVQRQVYEREFC
jgi:hypothetical protein